MYKVGDFLVHEGSGICEVVNISEMALGGRGTEKIYYTLMPYYDRKSQIFTPVDSAKVRIRDVMTKDEILDLIRRMPDVEPIEEVSDKLRAVKYKEALATFEPLELVRIIKTVQLGKLKRVNAGKKILMGDEKYSQIAQKRLYEEIAFSLDIPVKDVEKMIVDELATMALA